jgi:hypothetical protein
MRKKKNTYGRAKNFPPRSRSFEGEKSAVEVAGEPVGEIAAQPGDVAMQQKPWYTFCQQTVYIRQVLLHNSLLPF